MAQITAKDVQALRERTGVGMMDCKRALVEAEGDVEKAIVILREKGLATVAKKAGRIAAEGTIAIYNKNGIAVLCEVNAETDFVGKNEKFQAFAASIAALIAEKNPKDVDELNGLILSDGKTVEEVRQDLVMVIRENITVRRFVRATGAVATYNHGNGKIGVITVYNTSDAIAAKPEFAAFGKNVCMQVAALNPSYLNKESVPASVLASEKDIMLVQMKNDPKNANKPEAVLTKIIDGKMGKYYEQNCLTEQTFFMDETVTVGKYIANTAKELGGDIQITDMIRFEKGEGIEKRVDNFAEEVASMVK